MEFPYQAVVTCNPADLLHSNGTLAQVPQGTGVTVHAEEHGLGFVTTILDGTNDSGRMAMSCYSPVARLLDGMSLADFKATVSALKTKPAEAKPSKKAKQ